MNRKKNLEKKTAGLKETNQGKNYHFKYFFLKQK